jgi:hypothetical protein
MRCGFWLISSLQETFNSAIESSLKGLSVKIFIPHEFGRMAIHLFDLTIQRSFGLTSWPLCKLIPSLGMLPDSVFAGFDCLLKCPKSIGQN